MRKLRSIFVLSFVLAAFGLGSGNPLLAKKFPEPSIYPLSWELKFKHAIPKRIVVDVPGSGPTAYWYMTYTITNLSDSEQTFLPHFEMVSNEGKIITSDQAIPLNVFEAIKSAQGNQFLEPSRKISGTIHIGEDQAKDGVAIWEEPEARMGDFQIFAGGLSGEYIELTDDDKKPVLDKDGRQVILRKQLQLNYSIFGDEVKPGQGDEVHAKPEKWVMR